MKQLWRLSVDLLCQVQAILCQTALRCPEHIDFGILWCMFVEEAKNTALEQHQLTELFTIKF